MPEEKQIPEAQAATPSPAPALRDKRVLPEGVVPKQAQGYVIAGLAVVILMAVLFSNNHARPAAKPAASGPLAVSTDMNQRKIQELEQDLSADQRQGQQAQRAGNNSTASSVNGPTAPNGVASPATQLPPPPAQNTEPPRDPVADAEKAIAFKARFASNLVSATDGVSHPSSESADLAENTQARSSSLPPTAPTQAATGSTGTAKPTNPASLRASRSPAQTCSTASSISHRRSPSRKAIASRSTSPRICSCPQSRTTPSPAISDRTPTHTGASNMKVVRILSFIFVLLSTFAPMAHAQFGSGIVYDPTQSAHAIQQIEQGSQIYTTAVATRNQIVTMYNLAYQMSKLPQNLEARYKADWSQWTSLSAPSNTYGNTSSLVNALNYGALNQAQQGYSSAYVQAQSYPSGNYSSLDSRTQATVANQYATSELAQTTTTSTLSTLGTIRTDSQAFSTKLANLESDTFSTDPNQQTEAALLGKINSATLLQIHSQQDTNQLLMASIQQQLVAQKQQIDAQNRAINNAIYFQQNFPTAMQNVTGGVTQSLQSISLSPSGR